MFYEKLGIDVDGDGENRSPLMDAVQAGLEECIRLLVEVGRCDISQRDYEGWNALSLSVEALVYDDMEKAKRITKYLWDHGAREM